MSVDTDSLVHDAVQGDSRALSALLEHFSPRVTSLLNDNIASKWRGSIEPEDVMGVQVLGHTLKGMTECLNGALNLRQMKVGQLKAFAMKHYGKSIRGKKSLLIPQIEAAICGNTQ